ncbi:MAG: hypothetical protein J1F01_07115 [Oscillospiraceae bacterium]|nr:hypothetical protein [Oscillospiraceae bacterium]
MRELVDKLNRHKFINFVKNLIINSDNYKRNSESDSYVIALDSGWGTGKSFFIELLKNDIENTEANIRIVKYNAWENDYCENAFNPLFYDILSNETFESEVDSSNIKELGKAIMSIIKAFGKDVVKTAGLENTAEAVCASGEKLKDFMLRTLPEIKELKEQRESFEKFKRLLKETTNWFNDRKHKLVIIIDELDRCKPTFAIQTLEIVKHIFDIENLTFIFAIDIQQLSHSVECVYGQEIDATGYLCRFFDYIAKMPASNIVPYIQNTIKDIKSIPDLQTYSYKNSKNRCEFREDIANFIIDLYDAFDLSLRELDTIVQSYRIMLDNFLYKYQMVGAHIIYLFYLTLKYKESELFNELVVNTPSAIKINQHPKIMQLAENNFWIELEKLCESISLKEKKIHYSLYNDKGECDAVKEWHIDSVIGNNIRIKYLTGDFYSWRITNLEMSENESVDKILFYPDLQNWESIKNYTYREYLHKQLEMYNFVQEEKESE